MSFYSTGKLTIESRIIRPPMEERDHFQERIFYDIVKQTIKIAKNRKVERLKTAKLVLKQN